MTTEHIAKQIHHVLPEFMDSYLVIGRAANGEPLAMVWSPQKEHLDEINSMLLATLAQGGIRVPTRETRE